MVVSQPQLEAGELLFGARGDDVKIGLRRGERRSVLEPCDPAQVVASALLPFGFLERQGRPYFGVSKQREVRGHYADDGVEFAVQPEVLAQCVAAAGEPALPQSVAENGDAVGPELHFLGGECAAHEGLYVQHIEEISGNAGASQTLRFGSGRQVHPLALERGESGESMIVVAEIHIVAGRQRKLREAGLEVALPHEDELLRLVETDGLQ